MTVSIVIPCFNHARFLGQAIASARAQTWPKVEVIVVDDGSVDGSAAVASRYPTVTLIRQENRGLAAARNAGLAFACGDVIIFLDADDRLLPNAARRAVEAFAAHPEAAMVFGACRLVDAHGCPLPTALPIVHGDYYRALLRRNYIWMPGMAAFRRATLDAVGGFDSSVNPSADYDMYLRVTARFPIAGHNAVVAEYRQHGANMSADPALMLRATLTVLRRQRSPRTLHMDVRAWQTFYGDQLVDRFRTALHARRGRAAIRYAWTLLLLYPTGVRVHLQKKITLLVLSLVRTSPVRPVAAPRRSTQHSE